MQPTGEPSLFDPAARLVGYALYQALKNIKVEDPALIALIHTEQGRYLINIPLIAVDISSFQFKSIMAQWMVSSAVFAKNVHKFLAYMREHVTVLGDANIFYRKKPPVTDDNRHSALLGDFCGTFDELFGEAMHSPYFDALFPEGSDVLTADAPILRLPVIASLTDRADSLSVEAKKLIFAAIHGLLVAKFIFDVIPEYHGILPVDFDTDPNVERKKSLSLSDITKVSDFHILAHIGTKLANMSFPIKVTRSGGDGGNEEVSEVSGAAKVMSLSQGQTNETVIIESIKTASLTVKQPEGPAWKAFRDNSAKLTTLQTILHLFNQPPRSTEVPLSYYQLQAVIAIAQHTAQPSPISLANIAAYIDSSAPADCRLPILLLKRSKNIIIVHAQTEAKPPNTPVIMTQLASSGPTLAELIPSLPKETDPLRKKILAFLNDTVDWSILIPLAEKDLFSTNLGPNQRKAAENLVNQQAISWSGIMDGLLELSNKL